MKTTHPGVNIFDTSNLKVVGTRFNEKREVVEPLIAGLTRDQIQST